jgi:hypothetical protein
MLWRPSVSAAARTCSDLPAVADVQVSLLTCTSGNPGRAADGGRLTKVRMMGRIVRNGVSRAGRR